MSANPEAELLEAGLNVQLAPLNDLALLATSTEFVPGRQPIEIGANSPDSIIVATAQYAQRPGQIQISLKGPLRGRQITLSFPPVTAYWAYHVVGQTPEMVLRIEGKKGGVGFRDRGIERLPNGQAARLLVSESPILLSEQSQQQLSLIGEDEASGARTLIDTLPVASPHGLHRQGRSPPQADIYVTV